MSQNFSVTTPPTRYAPWFFSLFAAGYFCYQFIHINLLNSLSAELLQAFSWNANELALVSSLFFFPLVLLAIPAGLLLERYAVRQVILTTFALSLLGNALMALAFSSWVFGTGRLLTGVAHAFCFVACLRYAYHWMPPTQWASVTGWIVAIGILGGMLAQTPLTWLQLQWGWRGALTGVWAAGSLLWLAFWQYLLPPPLENTASHSSVSHAGRSLRTIAQGTTLWLASSLGAALNIPIMVLGALWSQWYLTAVHGLAHLPASLICSALFLGSLLGSPAWGFYSDYLGRRKILLQTALIGVSACMAGLIALPAPLPYSVLYALFLGMGFSSAGMVISYTVVGETHNSQDSGKAFAINTIVIMGGAMLLQQLFGVLLGTQPDHPRFDWALPGMLFCLLLALIASFLLPETGPASQEKRTKPPQGVNA